MTKTIRQNPAYTKECNNRRRAKNPHLWRDYSRADRREVIALLGGKCLACGITNPRWLRIDYIPTTRTASGGYPRHPKYIREHQDQFRVLCANHHYELKVNHAIEGTNITRNAEE